MRDEEQAHLPFPPDPQQISLMRSIVDDGNYLVASDGTHRFELCCQLADGGYMRRDHCPRAGGVHQFSVTRKGRAVIEEEKCTDQ